MDFNRGVSSVKRQRHAGFIRNAEGAKMCVFYCEVRENKPLVFVFGEYVFYVLESAIFANQRFVTKGR